MARQMLAPQDVARIMKSKQTGTDLAGSPIYSDWLARKVMWKVGPVKGMIPGALRVWEDDFERFQSDPEGYVRPSDAA